MLRKLEFIDNLINVKRYPSDTLIKSESVTDHVWGMIGLALEFVPIINKKYDPVHVNLESIITKIVLHDIDEALYCDIPRKFKYDNEELRIAIKNTSDKLLSSKVSPEIYQMIKASTDKTTPDGILVKIFDVAQSGYKMLSEIRLGNSNFITEIDNIIDCLEGLRELIEASELLPIVKTALNQTCLDFESDIETQVEQLLN